MELNQATNFRARKPAELLGLDTIGSTWSQGHDLQVCVICAQANPQRGRKALGGVQAQEHLQRGLGTGLY